MEIVEILSHHIDKVQNLINVEFRLLDDEDELTREDLIEYTFFEEFGYDNNKNFEMYEIHSEFNDDVDDWETDDFDYIDDDKLISFLNEYYIVYPKKLPKAQIR